MRFFGFYILFGGELLLFLRFYILLTFINVETRNLRVLLNKMLPMMDNNLIRADARIARLYNNKKTNYDNYPLRFFGFYILFGGELLLFLRFYILLTFINVETRNLRVLLNKMLPMMDNNLIRADARIARLYNNKKTNYDNYPLRFFGFYILFGGELLLFLRFYILLTFINVETRNLRVLLNKMLPMMDRFCFPLQEFRTRKEGFN